MDLKEYFENTRGRGVLATADADGRVDAADLKNMGEQWLARPSEPSADVAPPGGDDFVDLSDLAVVGKDWRYSAVAVLVPARPGDRPTR